MPHLLVSALFLLACSPDDSGRGFGTASSPDFEGEPVSLDDDMADFFADSAGPSAVTPDGIQVHGETGQDLPPERIAGSVDLDGYDIAQGRMVLWSPLDPSRSMSLPVAVDEDDSSHFEYSCDDASEIGLDLANDPVEVGFVVQLADGTVPRPVFMGAHHWPDLDGDGWDDDGLYCTGDLAVTGDNLVVDTYGNGGARAEVWFIDPWGATLAGPYDAESGPMDIDETGYDITWQAVVEADAVSTSSPEQLWVMMRSFDSDEELHGSVAVDPYGL